jgi:vacuolar-type H+-ATPase subunit F/Vma7
VIRHLAPDLNISHHCHAAANVKLALRYSVPTVVLFRDPKDAIPSLVTRFRPGLYEAVIAYESFYNTVSNLSENILLVSFDEITQNLENAIRKLRNLEGVHIDQIDDVAAVDRQVKERIRRWQKENKDPYTTPLPTEEREAKKELLRQKLLQMEEFQAAQEVYEKICRRYELQERRYKVEDGNL